MERWIKLTIIATVLNIIVMPLVKYAYDLGVPSSISAVINFSFTALFIVPYLIYKKENLKVNKKDLSIIVGIALSMVILNLSSWESSVISPNVGYSLVIVNSAMVIMAIYSKVIEKEALPSKKFLAILIILIGMVMVML